MSEMNLKELLTLNLDLIQHQQQLLITKDREIKKLVEEKAALKSRLERMERRMALLKQTNHEEGALKDQLTNDQKIITENSKKSGKRKSEGRAAGTPNRKQPRQILRSPVEVKEEAPQSPATDSPSHDAKTMEDTVKLVNHTVNDNIDLVRTSSSFHVPMVLFKDPEIVGKVVRKNEIKIEIPKWRFKPVSNCYQIEGTEMTDDDIYLKRHLRNENDEKRRKRWDLQRLREQTAYEKLVASRTRTEKVAAQENKPVTSLKADASEIRAIEVQETLPVNVFGYPLPELPSTSFSLKWPEKQTDEVPKDNRSKVGKRR